MKFVIAIIIVGVALIIYDIVFNLSPELDRNMKIEIGVKRIPQGEIFRDLP